MRIDLSADYGNCSVGVGKLRNQRVLLILPCLTVGDNHKQTPYAGKLYGMRICGLWLVIMQKATDVLCSDGLLIMDDWLVCKNLHKWYPSASSSLPVWDIDRSPNHSFNIVCQRRDCAVQVVECPRDFRSCPPYFINLHVRTSDGLIKWSPLLLKSAKK